VDSVQSKNHWEALLTTVMNTMCL